LCMVFSSRKALESRNWLFGVFLKLP